MIVYLDQNVISALALDHSTCGGAADLRDVLIGGKKQGKLFCPVPYETATESMSLPRQERLAVYDLQSQLAQLVPATNILVAFQEFWDVIKIETLALARASKPPGPFKFVRWNRPVDEKVAATWKKKLEDEKAEQRQRFGVFQKSGAFGSFSNLASANRFLSEEINTHFLTQLDRLKSGRNPDPSYHTAYGLAVFLPGRKIE